jgi:tRNA 2-thiouridine synthesizing protein A
MARNLPSLRSARKPSIHDGPGSACDRTVVYTVRLEQLWRVAMHFDKELDARGLNCPLPIIKTKKALGELPSGQVLKVTATDPGSVKDFEAFSRQTGHELLSSGTDANTFVFFLKKK